MLNYTAEKLHKLLEFSTALVKQLFSLFQGFLVAIIYCFCNGEVRSQKSCSVCAFFINSILKTNCGHSE